MIPIQAHHTAYHEKYPSKRLLLLMQRNIVQTQVFFHLISSNNTVTKFANIMRDVTYDVTITYMRSNIELVYLVEGVSR